MFKLFYFTVATFGGWWVLRDSYILPPALGGKGELTRIFTDFPYITLPPYYSLWFTGAMGYHLSGLVAHFFIQDKQNDYIEMMFHHIVTFYLFAFSFLSNQLIGGVIAIIHDAGDIFICINRIYAELHYSKRIMAPMFITFMFVWFYTRLMIFPYIIYVATIKIDVYGVSPYL